MSAQTLLSGGDKWFSYSGEVFGDVSVPATIQLILVPNTGLRDSYVKIMPNYGRDIVDTNNQQLGIQIKLNDTIIVNSQRTAFYETRLYDSFELFIPRQSKLEVIRLNTTGNNTQISNCNLIGYYL
jgi:hypothetical protein